jgi:serine/threonine protein kinase
VTDVSSASGKLPAFVGRYKVVDRIGKGAMGVVYGAQDEQLGRRVAVKLMLADFEEEPELRERFYREARITGQLAHKNIVTLFDLGEDQGRPFIVMELLDGVPLSEYLGTASSSSIDVKVDLMMQLCDGLQTAHEAGVVHRDVKPSNIFILKDGTLKVLDFGVARLSASNLTASGMLLGTPEYMAPEQARGSRMDARSDVFSAGGVCYFMLTGRAPFGSRDLRKVLQAIINDPPIPITDDEAPEALQQILMKALSKSPEDRFQQCAEMREALAHVRRTNAASTIRVINAAHDRFQQILALIEDRRETGRMLGVSDIDAACDDAVARLKARFPPFAAAQTPAAMEPMDRTVARATLEALQARHNAEQAALAALRERAGAPGPGASAEPPSQRGGFWRSLIKPRD